MSVRLDGRSRRELRSPSLAIRQLVSSETKAMPPIHETNLKTIITFLLIVLGGTLLTIGTIIDSRLLYWMGGLVLFVTGIYLIVQSSRLNNPCSPQ
jgi:hypothetical protein